jgi:putative NADH-flavin reductase
MRILRLLIIGASRGTGALAVKTALERGHAVTAFARHPEKLALENARLTRVPGDFHDAASVAAAVADHDAVIITASSTTLKGFRENPRYFSLGTEHTIAAMRAHGVKRLIVLSALGVGESRQLANFFVDKLLISLLLRQPYADHERQEKLVMESGLDWVIARPTRLTDGPARGRYVKQPRLERVPTAISRADVADFLVTAAEVDTWLRQAVQLGG